MTRIYIIAGEPSGDNIGASLLKSLRILDKDVIVKGIGGNCLYQGGLNSLFPMKELSIMGFFEVLPNLLNLKKRIHETVQDILNFQPDVLVTIDSPGFCFRVIQSLKKNKISFPCVHYVAPSVWAWRPKRANHMAKFLDHLLCLFPFEPPYFARAGLTTTFVGHPVVERMRSPTSRDFLPSLLLLPGSRLREVREHLPVFLEAAKLWRKNYQDVPIYLSTFFHLLPVVKEITQGFPIQILIDEKEKAEVLQKTYISLCASGTVTLELIQARCPMVTAYKVSYITVQILRHLVNTPCVNLGNIIYGKKIIPECLQKKCSGDILFRELIRVTQHKEDQEKMFEEVMASIGVKDKETPSYKSAVEILRYAQR